MNSSTRHSIRNRDISTLGALSAAAVCVLCLLLSGAVYASDETIVPDSWIYPALRTFELAGYVELDPAMPYARSEVERYVARIIARAASNGRTLTPRQSFLLERMKDEFVGKSQLPGEREDRPLLLYEQEDDFAAFDVVAGALFTKPLEWEKGEVWGIARPELLMGLGGRMTVQTVYRLKVGPERGSNMFRSRPSPRERSFRGMTSEYEKGLISASGKRWGIRFGRDYLHWGNGRDEGLILSKTAGSLDHLAAYLTWGRVDMAAIHAFLDERLERRFAGHRVAIRLPKGIRIGFSETVVYTDRSFDYSYLLPFGSYYGNQFNESTDDNVLWGFDWKVPIARGLLVYGELIVDDFQYERKPPAPDRLGFTMTIEGLVGIGEREIELLAGYTYVDIYTYAHDDSLVTRYVTGNGDPTINRFIGSPLGPDSDRWNARISIPLSARVLIGVQASRSRMGEGSDFREWNGEEDPDPRFPSGEVLEETIIAIDQSIDLDRGSYVNVGGGWRFLEGGPSHLDDEDGFFYLELLLDF